MLVQATILSAVKPRTVDAGATSGSSGAPSAVQVQPAQLRPEAQTRQAQAAPQEAASLEQTLQGAQEAAEAAGANLQFTIDKDSGKTIVKVVDSETSEVIRQIPSEELLALARSMSKTEGLLISQKA
jgi:flagellar protein FlaG